MSAGTIVRGAPRPLLHAGASRARSLLGSPELPAVIAFTALAAVLRFVAIGHQGFWFDEGNTVLLVHLSPGQMLGLIPRSESTPPLYYCVAWIWAHAFGFSETPLRSLSALFGVLTVPVAYAAGRRLISSRAGVIAAALTACNPLLIWYSQEARSYELLVLLSAATVLAFAHVRARPTPRALAAWLLACVLALATHYYAVLAVVPQALWLLWVHRLRRPVLAAVAGVVVCAVPLLVLAINQKSTGRASWIANVDLGRRLGQVVPQFLTGFPAPGQGVIEPICVAIAAGAVLLLLARSDHVERRGALVAGALALAGLLLNLLLIAGGVDDLITRNVLALWMPAALLVAGGLAARRAQALGTIGAAALCAAGVAVTVGIASERGYERPDWRGVARLLGTRAQPAAPRAILVQHYRDLLPMSLYLPHLRFMKRPARVSELDVVSFTSPPSSGFCWWGSGCNLWPSTMQASYHLPGFRAMSRRHVYQFTVLRMVADRPTLVTPAELARALQTTTFKTDGLLIQR